MSGGEVTLGTQTVLLFDNTTITEARMHSYMSFTSTDYTCEVGDVTNHATDILAFAGISFNRYPYKPMSMEVSTAYLPTSLNVEYDAQHGGKNITVLNQCVAIGIAGPDNGITAGQRVALTNQANHSTTDTHDGMLGPAFAVPASDTYNTAAMSLALGAIGIARTGATVDATASNHAGHTWDMEDNEAAGLHPAFEVLLWR